MPIIRNAISAFEGAAGLLQGSLKNDALEKAAAMGGEYRRLSLLPADQLLAPYETPKALKLATLTKAAVKGLLPQTGERVWAREAAGRLASLSLLTTGKVDLPLARIRFAAASEEVDNQEAKARIGTAAEAIRVVMNTDPDADVRATARRAYNTLVNEWTRLNSADIAAAAQYQPDVGDIQQASQDLKDTRDHLQTVGAVADVLETLGKVIALFI